MDLSNLYNSEGQVLVDMLSWHRYNTGQSKVIDCCIDRDAQQWAELPPSVVGYDQKLWSHGINPQRIYDYVEAGFFTKESIECYL